MIKKILSLLTIILISISTVEANDHHKDIPQKLSFKERRQMELFLNKELTLLNLNGII